MKTSQTSNVFYTFGFLLLYIHLLMNIVHLTVQKAFFDTTSMTYSIIPFGINNLTMTVSLFEVLLVGGFILFALFGLIKERIHLIGLKKEAEAGWQYRNRLKLWYSIIAILLVCWTTIQGYLIIKEFDWVWLSGSAVIVVFSIILASFPRYKAVKE